MITEEGTYTGVGGAELFYRVFYPKAAPKAAVILVHGFGDHSGGLQNISKILVRQNYAVYAFDLRGHGKSSGKRGYIRCWDDFREDLHEFRKFVSLEQPNLPFYIIGHSMGGVITLEYSLDYGAGISGIVAISPGISYEVTPLERLGITLLGKLKPDFRYTKSGNFQLKMKDSAKLSKDNPDYLRHNTATPGLGYGLIQAVSRVVYCAESINVPLLLQYGLDDKITPPTKLRHFFNEVASKHKQVVEYPNVKHRPFDDMNRELFFADLIGWLDQQTVENQKNQYKSVGY